MPLVRILRLSKRVTQTISTQNISNTGHRIDFLNYIKKTDQYANQNGRRPAGTKAGTTKTK